jgi:hypothetical protein
MVSPQQRHCGEVTTDNWPRSQPITAIQNLLPPKETSMALSQVFFGQYLGGAVFLALGETIFTNTLRSSLKSDAPSIDPDTVINAGASAVRSLVPDGDLDGVLRAYDHAIISTFVSRPVFFVDHRTLTKCSISQLEPLQQRSLPLLVWVFRSCLKRMTKRSRNLTRSDARSLLEEDRLL